MKGMICWFEYSEYEYENMMLDGVYKEGGFKGGLWMEEGKGCVEIEGNLNVGKRMGEFKVKGWVKKVGKECRMREKGNWKV